MVKILIADDHALVREGIKQILERMFQTIYIDEASDSREVLQKVWKKHYDIILLDISMPGRNGLDTLRQIKDQRPDSKILILSLHSEEYLIMQAYQMGASGYLTKNNTSKELTSAIQKILKGKKYINLSIAENLAMYLETINQKPPHEALSTREYEVMCMIASGKTLKEIADEMSLSAKTISTYRSRIMDKMRVQNNSQLTYYAFQKGLVK